jgi:hypothetical protein
MMSSNWFVFAVLSLFLLFGIVSMAREAVSRLKAGPIRFRLPLASMAKPPQMPAWRTIVLVLCMLLMLSVFCISGNARDLVVPVFCLNMVVNNRQAVHPRRQTRRWLVLAAGLLGLVLAAMCLAIGLGVFQASLFGMPWWLMLMLSAVLLVGGAMTIRDGLSGTLVRERGLEIMGETHPWSRIVVKDWQERDGGFALRVSIVSPRLFGMPYGPDAERIVPVLATERPALAAFLGEHVSTAV